MVKKWTMWVNPRNGKIYTVINKKNNPDGTKTVRILNEAGKLVKEKNIVPKKIIVIDNFDTSDEFRYDIIDYFFKSHGDIVETFLKRNNPVADVECIPHNVNNPYSSICAFEDILRRIKNGEKIDVINCSFAHIYDMDESITGCAKRLKQSYPVCKELVNAILSSTDEECLESKKLLNLIEDIISTGTRIVFGSGNNGKMGFNAFTGARGVDVVGALGQDGLITDYTSSIGFIQHFELGEIKPKISKYGINITGLPGADKSFEHTVYDVFQNKKLEECLANNEEFETYDRLEKKLLNQSISRDDFNTEVQRRFIGKLKPSKTQGEYISFPGVYKHPIKVKINNGQIVPCIQAGSISGTSLATPIRSAKIALNETMKEILDT